MNSSEELLSTLNESTCSFTTVKCAEEKLLKNNFTKLNLGESWDIKPGGSYVANIYDSSIVAFTVGSSMNLKVGCAHTDHPCIYIKPSPEMVVDGIYGKLNIEVYGGAILNTWLDRPLSIAGRVALKTEDILKPEIRIIDIKKPILTIPNLAIHLNKEINKGVELNKQVDMLPLCTMFGEEIENKGQFFAQYLAKQLDVKVEDILDYELYVYNAEPAMFVGFEEEFISAPRIDNISSVQALINGILDDIVSNGINVIALFDNEEIGSRSKQGADSSILAMILEKIYMALGCKREEYIDHILNGMMLSLDVSHAYHPNKTEKSDPTNKNYLNKGFIIKRASSQTYATDSEMIGIIQQICLKNDIPFQKYAVRSDGTTGSTLGTIAGKYLPMRAADIGVPILAMHSARELMGRQDQEYIERFINCFFRA